MYCDVNSFFPTRDLQAALADGRKHFSHDEKRVLFCKPRCKIWRIMECKMTKIRRNYGQVFGVGQYIENLAILL